MEDKKILFYAWKNGCFVWEEKSFSIAKYWEKKYNDRTFHSNPHGEPRNFKYSEEDLIIIQALLWQHAKKNPCLSIKDHQSLFKEAGFLISQWYIGSIFRGWRWSWKVPAIKQIHKYSPQNIEKYLRYVAWKENILWSKMRFLDEAHFAARHLAQTKALSKIGEPVITCNFRNLKTTFSVTMIT